MSRWVDIANMYYFTPGSRHGTEVYGVSIAVFNIDGECYAIRDACPNDGDALSHGELWGDEIICPRHGERYSVRTGTMSGQTAKQRLDIFPVRISHGKVQVEINIPDYA